MATLSTSHQSRREDLRRRLSSGRILVLPGAFNPLTAKLIERHGFEAVYLSGAVIAADLGLPDIGLTTLSEVVNRAGQVVRATELPVVVDADTGFGEPVNVARTVRLLEDAGVAGLHIEDQVNPKRCGHLDGKEVVTREAAIRRIRAAVSARRDPNLLIIARTDARAVHGLADAIERAKEFVEAGADVIFPEALLDESEFREFRRAIDAPILANATEFGKGHLWDVQGLANIGIDMVIFPVSLFRLAMGSTERGLLALREHGGFASMLEHMQTRAELYDVLEYASYGEFDSSVFGFELPG